VGDAPRDGCSVRVQAEPRECCRHVDVGAIDRHGQGPSVTCDRATWRPWDSLPLPSAFVWPANILAKLPERPGLHARVRAAYWAALDGATSPSEAERGLRVLVGELSAECPSAAACLADDLPALTVHLAYLLRLRKRLRSTNLLERSLEDVRRRTKVIGRFPGEASCLTMAWAVMDLVIACSRGLGLTLPDRHAIATLIAAQAIPETAQAIA